MLPEPQNISIEDANMEARCILPPEWYIIEVRKGGGVGVQLPQEEWERYLKLYEKKKSTAPYTPWSRENEEWLARRKKSRATKVNCGLL